MEAQEQEILLSAEDIAIITENAKRSLLNRYQGIIMMQFTKNWWDVLQITPHKRLLFIQGHKYTGLEHINDKHRYFTNQHNKFKEGFKTASKFSKDSGMLDDYVGLAECLYDERFLIPPPKNKRPDIFEMYQARIDFKERNLYTLLVYKGSKIIHTLFPDEKGRKTRLYKKNDIQIEYENLIYIRAIIPYTDINDVPRFAIGIEFYLPENREEWTLVIYEGNRISKTAKITEKTNLEYKFGVENRIEGFNYADFTELEDKVAADIKSGKL